MISLLINTIKRRQNNWGGGARGGGGGGKGGGKTVLSHEHYSLGAVQNHSANITCDLAPPLGNLPFFFVKRC